MSDLRIRSEAVPDTHWPRAFIPMAVTDAAVATPDDADFGPFLAAVARSLTLLFGVPVEVVPALAPTGPLPSVAPVLAALLATARLGGDMARATRPGARAPDTIGGVAMARHARAIDDALAAVAARAWPATARRAGLDLDIAVGAITGHARVAAPDRPDPGPPPPPPLATRLFDLPMRVRVELSSGLVAVAALLPLRAGTILPIDPVPEMALIVGDHCIGRAIVTSQPDGRQQANVTAINVETRGGPLT